MTLKHVAFYTNQIFLLCILLVNVGPSDAQVFGWPPGESDDKLMRLTPDSPLVVSTWSAAGEVNPNGIPTEKWLAQKEIQESLAKFKSALVEFMVDSADSELGAKFAKDGLWRLLSNAGTFAITRFPSGDDHGEGVLAFSLGADESYFQELLTESANDDSMVTFEFDEHTGYRLELSETLLEICIVDDYLVASLGSDQLAPTIERLQSNTSPPDWLVKQMEDAKIERRSTFTYIDIEKLFELTKLMDPETFEEFEKYNKILRLDEFKSACLCTGMDSMSSVSRLRIECGRTGMSSILDVEPMEMSELLPIPNDSVSAFVMKVSVDNAMDLFHQLAEVAGLEEEGFGLESISEELGIDLEKDLLDHLEGTMASYSSGSIIAAQSVMWLKVKDATAARDAIQRINKTVQEYSEEGGYSFSEKKSRQGIMTYGMKFDFSLQNFYWALHEDQLYFSNNSRAISSHIRKSKDTQGKVVADPFVAGIFAAAEKHELGQPIGLQRVDIGPIAEAVFPILQTFLGDQTAPGFDFSFADVPDADILTKDFRPNTSFLLKTETGYETYSRHDLPVSIEASTGILIGMMLPAIQQVRQASRTTQAQNNLRQLQLALLNYEAANAAFPAAYSTNEEGKPLLSWRVHILPFLEESELYEQFNLDEPWDSDHNLELIDQMPTVFSSPQLVLDDGKTVFVAPVGDDTIIRMHPDKDGTASGNRMDRVEDGVSNTILVCEAGERQSVIWTSPNDLNLEELELEIDDFEGAFETGHPNLILLGLADGAIVTELITDLTLERFKGICNMSDGIYYEPSER
jgi:hypothetical protein